MKNRLPKVYMNVIEDMYEEASINIYLYRQTEDFTVKVGVHQGLDF